MKRNHIQDEQGKYGEELKGIGNFGWITLR
jgi:hypothetical protein